METWQWSVNCISVMVDAYSAWSLNIFSCYNSLLGFKVNVVVEHYKCGLSYCTFHDNISSQHNCTLTIFTTIKVYSFTVIWGLLIFPHKYNRIKFTPSSFITHLQCQSFNTHKHAKPREHSINKCNEWHKCNKVGSNSKHHLYP